MEDTNKMETKSRIKDRIDKISDEDMLHILDYLTEDTDRAKKMMEYFSSSLYNVL